MREAARQVLEFVQGLDYNQFVATLRVRFAVERGLEILGEAARRVSPSFREAHPEVPWRQIIGLRNAVAHEYDDINFTVVWEVLSFRLPELVSILDALIPPVPGEND